MGAWIEAYVDEDESVCVDDVFMKALKPDGVCDEVGDRGGEGAEAFSNGLIVWLEANFKMVDGTPFSTSNNLFINMLQWD